MKDHSELRSLLEYAEKYKVDRSTCPYVEKFCRLTELTTTDKILDLLAEIDSLKDQLDESSLQAMADTEFNEYVREQS